MSNVPDNSKRQFLITSAQLLAALGLAGTAHTLAARGFTSADPTAVLSNQESAIAIGDRVLRQYPELLTDQSWATQLLSKLAVNTNTTLSAEQLHVTLRKAASDAVTHDFTHNLTLQVDGWVLAETEAHLCALVALQQG